MKAHGGGTRRPFAESTADGPYSRESEMSLLESILGITKLATKIANPDLLKAVADANVQAMELSKSNLDLQKRVGELERQILRMRGLEDLKAKLFVNGGYLYIEGDPNPRCLTCWDHSGELIHVLPPITGIFPQCTVCKNFLDVIPKTPPKRGDTGSVPVG
jgi:hypothetical protein